MPALLLVTCVAMAVGSFLPSVRSFRGQAEGGRHLADAGYEQDREWHDRGETDGGCTAIAFTPPHPLVGRVTRPPQATGNA